MKTRVVFVTGASCAGKTHVGRELYDLYGDPAAMDDEALAWCDLDEDATERPATNWLSWLQWRAGEAMLAATSPVTIITGIVWPFSLIESPAWRQAQGELESVEFVLLDPPWRTVLRPRLLERLAAKPKREQRETLAYNRDLRVTLRRQVQALKGGHVLDYADERLILPAVQGIVA